MRNKDKYKKIIEDVKYDDYCGIVGVLSGYHCHTCLNCEECIHKQNTWLEEQFNENEEE